MVELAMRDPDGEEPDQVAYLWPDCRRAWSLWNSLQTQWRVGTGGRTGLDYTAVCTFLGMHEDDAEERRSLLSCIQAAEHAVLSTWAEQRERERLAMPGR